MQLDLSCCCSHVVPLNDSFVGLEKKQQVNGRSAVPEKKQKKLQNIITKYTPENQHDIGKFPLSIGNTSTQMVDFQAKSC